MGWDGVGYDFVVCLICLCFVILCIFVGYRSEDGIIEPSILRLSFVFLWREQKVVDRDQGSHGDWGVHI